MLSKFTLRGYPKIITQQAYHETFLLQRNNLLKTKMKKRSKRIPLVVTYNRTLPPLGAIVNKHWYILQSDTKMEDKFNERPVVAYRPSKNLRDMIGSNKSRIKNSSNLSRTLVNANHVCPEVTASVVNN